MDEEVFNKSVRKFLKKVGITSQKELESTVREALEKGQLQGDETLPVKISLESDLLDEPLVIEDELKLS